MSVTPIDAGAAPGGLACIDGFLAKLSRAGERFQTEREAQAFVCEFLRHMDWKYVEQYPAGTGRIDVVLTDCDGQPRMGIEVKRSINKHTSASELADYLEQAVGYSRVLDIPVVVGPAMLDLGSGRSGFTRLSTGGARIDSLAGLTIFGGRVNVGVLAFDDRRPADRMCIAFRGQTLFALDRSHPYDEELRAGTLFRPDLLRMVRSTNSQKVRR